MGRLRTYGLLDMTTDALRDAGIPTSQCRLIVAAPSRKAAGEILRAVVAPTITDRYLATYGGETANEHDVAVATAEPGVVFALPDGPRRQLVVRLGGAP